MKHQLKLFALLVVAVLAFASCNNKYQLKVTNLPEEFNGFTFHLTDMESEEDIDSAIVKNGVAIFEGELKSPKLVAIDGLFWLIIEPKKMTFDINDGTVTGSPLNDKLKTAEERLSTFYDSDEVTALSDEFIDSTTSDTRREQINHTFDSMMRVEITSLIRENNTTVVSEFLFMQFLMDEEVTKEEMDHIFEGASKEVKNFLPIKKKYESLAEPQE